MQGIEILFQPSVLPRLFEGLMVTLWIAGVSVLAALPAGILVGWLMTVENKFVRLIMRIYLDIIRIMPQLALLYIVYYGFARAWNVNFDATFATIIVFIAWGAAELGDLVRGALQSIPDSQRENARMLGMNSVQSFAHVILPQALRRLVPASVNLATRMVKTTSLAVLLGVVEVIKVGQQIIDVNRMAYPQGALWIYGVIFFMYFFISWPLSLLARYLEKKWSHE
ncbi:amino acid ABC transporter permease [Alloscardovia omnicolens]|uniref:amino acid ABC transporter permease n=1 Tax=Alloscardovia omnicolens TaxID=419015 RepID=UPI003A6817A6